MTPGSGFPLVIFLFVYCCCCFICSFLSFIYIFWVGRERKQDTWKTNIKSSSKARLLPVLLLAKLSFLSFTHVKICLHFDFVKHATVCVSGHNRNTQKVQGHKICVYRSIARTTGVFFVVLLDLPKVCCDSLLSGTDRKVNA